MQIKILENVSLAPLTTLKVGGAARFLVEAETEAEILQAVSFARQNDLPLFVLGGGSNVLISDRGFDGLVLKISSKGIDVAEGEKSSQLTAQAGEDWDQFVEFCVERNLQGVECLSGIPGTIGGTPVQNVGAYGQEVSETITKVRVYDHKSKDVLELSNAECKFAYRASLFNTTEKNRFIVIAVTFGLERGAAPKIVYKDLQNFFGDKAPTLTSARQAVLEIRRAKSMVIDENDPNSKSAGSFFKNPLVTKEKFGAIEAIAKRLGFETIPKFEAGKNLVKIPAAWLIEKSGFHKGYKLGNAGLSSKHTLALVNLGEASAQDILNLKQQIQSRVKENFDVDLIPEPVFVGFE